MSSYVNNQKSNVTFFAVGVVLSALLIAGASFLFYKALTMDSQGLPVSNRACLDTLRGNGFTPQITPTKELSVLLVRESGIESLVYQAGVAIASCPTYKIKSFCAGSGCERQGVQFVLSPK